MCKGKDTEKPHLHYTAEVRQIALRLSGICNHPVATILEISTVVGLMGTVDFIQEIAKGEASFIDSHAYARLVATKALCNELVREVKQRHQEFTDDPVKAMRLVQDDLPF